MATVPLGLANALADRYRVERELGQGGMATVYLAHDLKHDRDVALKVLRPELAAVLGRERFLAEIRLTAKLDHPHILTLHDSGESDGFLWYAVPFIRGESLRQKLTRDRQLDIQVALLIAKQVAGALAYAHRQGVIHRDIKPENILLHEGEAVLADFGIALAVKEAAGNRLTETGLSLGTPQYMSPEQATGDRQLDARSDIYSLASVLYEMLAGEPPHTGATVQAVIAKLMTEKPTSLRVLRDTVSEVIDAAVSKALAKLPVDRFPSVVEFQRAMEEPGVVTTGASVQASLEARPARRRQTVYVLVLLVAALGVAAVWWALRSGGQPALGQPVASQLTTTGRATLPAITRDGRFLAYVEEGQVFVVGLPLRGNAVAVLQGAERMQVGTPRSLEWSADGTRLWLYADSGAFSIPALGGTATRLWRAYDPRVSPLGDRVAYYLQPAKYVMLVDLGTGKWDSVPLPGEYRFIFGVAWAPDARSLAVLTTDGERQYTIRWVDLAKGTSRVLLADSVWIGLMSWSHAADAIYYVRAPAGIGGYLMRLPVSPASGSVVRPPMPVLPYLEYYSYSVADDGRLALSRSPSASNLWTRGMARDTARRWLTTGTIFRTHPKYSPDGDRVAYLALDGTSQNLFVTSADSGTSHQLTFLENQIIRDFAWSPDGQAIAFCDVGETPPRIGIVATKGGQPMRPATLPVSQTCSVEWLSANEVLYQRPGNRNFGVLSRRRAPPRELVTNDSVGWMFSPRADPTGRYVAVSWNRRDSAGVWLLSPTDSSQRLLLPGRFNPVRWNAAGDVLYARSGNFLYRLELKRPAQARPVKLPEQCSMADIAPDGNRLVCAEPPTTTSDIWLVSGLSP